MVTPGDLHKETQRGKRIELIRFPYESLVTVQRVADRETCDHGTSERETCDRETCDRVKLVTVKRVAVTSDRATCVRETLFLHPLASSPCLLTAAGLPDEHIPMDFLRVPATEGDYLPLLSASCIHPRTK